jgi:hypothetical protein
MTNLGRFGGTVAEALGINDSGQILAYRYGGGVQTVFIVGGADNIGDLGFNYASPGLASTTADRSRARRRSEAESTTRSVTRSGPG